MAEIDSPTPPPDCPRCPRLAELREGLRHEHPDWYNAPVPSFGDPSARLLIVGLAPGLKGANRTGRPFTGDYAGHLLYETLIAVGLATGRYEERADDGLRLKNCLITNALRCVPPQNKPTGEELKRCRPYLEAQIAALPHLAAILALGRIAHDSVLAALGLKRNGYKFSHGVCHILPSGVAFFDSYHCSRYNTQTRRLTESMFRQVVAAAKAEI